jgi:hypothetical protein
MRLIPLTASLLGVALFAPATFAVPSCSELATGLSGSPGVKSVNSQIIPPSGPNVSYCQVNVLYGENANQNINIRVGLPLNSADGGTGGTAEGAWNGRTQGVGGGGCSGTNNVNAPVNARYVGSGTDGGHAGGNCEPGVNLDGTYNVQFIQDWSRNGIKQQILFSKAIAATYYGAAPQYNYWNGCSTGGRQGYLLAQELGNELDGILANAPAIYWTRFQTAQMWGQIVMKDLNGGVIIPTAKQNFATARATAACDAADGVTDGIIDDPRTCTYSAASDPAAVCLADGGTSADPNCLTPAQAQAMDKIWDGPRNPSGVKIWFHSEPGSGTTVWNGTNPFALGVTQFHWDEADRDFDWHTVTMFGAGGTDSYADIAYDGSTNPLDPAVDPDYSLADATDTFSNLDTFKAHGGKLLTMVGAYDNFIMPRGVINYYREMAARYGKNPNKPDFETLQGFYRLFRAPGVGHCGGGVGPQPQNLFGALVAWVEEGVAPDTIPASGGGRTRPLCPYPTWAIYNGSGDTNVAANFHCGGNLETAATVCKDVLAKYKHENEADTPIDYSHTGVNRNTCRQYLGTQYNNP